MDTRENRTQDTSGASEYVATVSALARVAGGVRKEEIREATTGSPIG